jgi:uncharacterized membrane protein YhaH (DUF805 family)
MLAAIKHGLTNLTNFAGRDARQAFWFYVLFIYLITIAIGMVVSIPMTMQAMMTGVQQGIANAQAGNTGNAATEAAMQAAIARSMGGWMSALVWVSFATALILFLGLAASLVRRLHDANMSGYWALLPGVLQAFSIAMVPQQLAMMDEILASSMSGNPMGSFGMVGGSVTPGAVAGWVAIIAVIVFGTRPSTEGPNQYGEAPFTA